MTPEPGPAAQTHHGTALDQLSNADGPSYSYAPRPRGGPQVRLAKCRMWDGTNCPETDSGVGWMTRGYPFVSHWPGWSPVGSRRLGLRGCGDLEQADISRRVTWVMALYKYLILVQLTKNCMQFIICVRTRGGTILWRAPNQYHHQRVRENIIALTTTPPLTVRVVVDQVVFHHANRFCSYTRG